MEAKRPLVIVGCGPGDLDYLTPLARRRIEEAQVLVGAERLLDLFPFHPAQRVIAGANISEVLREVERQIRSRRVVVLVTGDPGLCSLARPIIRRFGPGACEVIPGISSIQMAFARVGCDWLNARILDAHGANPEIHPVDLAREEKIAILLGRPEALKWVADLVQLIGGNYAVYLCEDLTLPGEKVRQVESRDLERLQVSSRTVVLLIKDRLDTDEHRKDG